MAFEDAASEAASMGPPELPGGNAEKRGTVGAPAASLQWGRRNYPAETAWISVSVLL